MNVQMIPLHEIKPYENNIKEHPIKQLEAITHSIKTFGFRQPLVIDKNKTIVAGHARYEAAATLGMESVPCEMADNLTDDEINAYRILDNEIAKMSTTNIEALNIEIEKLPNFDFEPFNLEIPTFEKLNEGLCDENEIPQLQKEIKIKPGNVWILGNHRLMCGDSTMVDDVEKLINKGNPILMVTDPPYGVNHDPSWRDEYCIGKRGFSDKHANSKGLVKNDDRADWKDAYSLFNGDVVYIWHNAKFTALIADNLQECGFNLICQIIWAKQHFSFGRGDYHWQHEPCWYAVKEGKKHNYLGDRKQTTLWQIESLNPIGLIKTDEEKQEKTGHSTQKPIECMERPIRNNSSPNDEIYDPFGGSGTTLIACEKTNRKCYMMEISPQYCGVIIERWENFTGNKAYLDNVSD